MRAEVIRAFIIVIIISIVVSWWRLQLLVSPPDPPLLYKPEQLLREMGHMITGTKRALALALAWREAPERRRWWSRWR